MSGASLEARIHVEGEQRTTQTSTVQAWYRQSNVKPLETGTLIYGDNQTIIPKQY